MENEAVVPVEDGDADCVSDEVIRQLREVVEETVFFECVGVFDTDKVSEDITERVFEAIIDTDSDEERVAETVAVLVGELLGNSDAVDDATRV